METKLTKVFLHGRLGKLYGKEWSLAVRSPAEAIRAINANTQGKLRNQLYKEGTSKFYKVCLGNPKNALDKTEIVNLSGNVPIHIVPVAKGRNSGIGKIIAGAALIAMAVFMPGTMGAVAGFFGSGVTGGMVALSVGMMGASLILGGVTQMLTPTPNFNQNSDGDGRGSNLFQGNSVVTTQGSAVGLVYGRMMVTPMPVSVAFDNYDQAGTPSGDTQEYDSDYNNSTGLLEQTPVANES
jgi:predicted phage tail protein